jgi:hypothetical protein
VVHSKGWLKIHIVRSATRYAAKTFCGRFTLFKPSTMSAKQVKDLEIAGYICGACYAAEGLLTKKKDA